MNWKTQMRATTTMRMTLKKERGEKRRVVVRSNEWETNVNGKLECLGGVMPEKFTIGNLQIVLF